MDIQFNTKHVKLERKNVLVKNYSLSHAFKQLRKAAKLTQEDAGKMLELSRASIANIELGTQALSFEHFENFVNQLGFKVKIQLVKDTTK